MALSATAAGASGIDRSGQPVDLLFRDGTVAEFTFDRTIPALSGTGVGLPGLPGGTRYPDVGAAFSIVAGGLKWQIGTDWSAALLVDTSYGADVVYPGAPGSTELGGTSVEADGLALTALLRYRMSDSWSVHGGLRLQRAGGEIRLGGLSYGFDEATAAAAGLPTLNGYRVRLEDQTAPGWVAGLSFELPEIALRVSLTYFSPVSYSMRTRESGPRTAVDHDGDPTTPPLLLSLLDGASRTRIDLPQAVNLDVQTGIAPGTLLFGQLRWVDWSAFRIDPEHLLAFTGEGLIDLEDGRTWTLGLGRRFNDSWAGSVAVIYDEPTRKLSSPLSPLDGYTAVALAGAYTLTEHVTVAAGVRHSWLGDASPETGTPDIARARFSGQTATSLTLRLGLTF